MLSAWYYIPLTILKIGCIKQNGIMYEVVSEFKEMFLRLNTLIPIKVLNT